MILSGKKRQINRDYSGWLFTAVLLLILSGFLIGGGKGKEEKSSQPEGIFCSAENVEGDYFVSNGIRFGGGAQQHTRNPHTGDFSCQLTPENRYGLIYETTDFVKGAKYLASVWRFTESSKGFLVVEGNEGSGFKIVERVAIESKNGFEKVQIIFNVPLQDNLDTLRIYAGVDKVSGTVYVDDLNIRLLQGGNLETNFNPDKLDIEVSPNAYEQFNDQKWKAVKEGILISGDEHRVSGKMYSRNETREIPIKLRLKGDWMDHLMGNKWSFRIKTGGESSWNRMRTFSIQNPITRGFLKEWVFHEMLRKEDILNPKYDFIEVSLNGNELGVYAFEEHFDKHLPESQSRREGPILKLTEDLFWLGMKRQFTLQYDGDGLYQNKENAFEGSDIRPFKESKTQLNQTLAQQFQLAQTLLHQFKYDQKPASEIFDLHRIAKYTAIMDVLGAYHGTFWHNLRFYYNPISSKLEPIGFDGFGSEDTQLNDQIVLGYKVNTHETGEDLTKLLFKDPVFFRTYMHYLYQFTDNTYITNFFADIEADINARETLLAQEFEGYTFQKKPFVERARDIHLLLEAQGEQSVLVRIQLREAGDLALKINNTHPFPVEIIGYGRKVSTIDFKIADPVFVPSNPSKSLPQYVELKVPEKTKHLFYQVAGIDSVYATPLVDWPIPGAEIQRQKMLKDTLRSNDVYEVVDNKILIKKGLHISQQDINIPAGYKVYFEAGANLDLQKNAAFISWSPVFMLGTEDAPVQVFSSDESGNGFTVLQAAEPSRVEYTRFDKLNTLNKGGWILTGAVNFFESDVRINKASFTNNLCEDGLNIVHSKFTLENSLIANTFSDGFDSDFCEGTVKNVTFRDTGNDGMDLSGSIISITGLKVFNAGDKGLSVGEKADVHLIDGSVTGANTGVASKDLSMLKIDQIHLENCIKGFTAYQKKPEYGKANIIVRKYSATDVKHLFLLDKGSVIDIDGEKHTGEI